MISAFRRSACPARKGVAPAGLGRPRRPKLLRSSGLRRSDPRALPRRIPSQREGETLTQGHARALEAEWVRRTLGGERDAFRQIVLAQQGFLAELVFRQTGDRHATEDLVQETFLRAFKALRRYDERYRLSTWLARIALNVARDHGRRCQVAERAVTRLSEASASLDPAEVVAQREASAQVDDALRSLPSDQREVIVLAMWGGLTQREVAAALELPLGTVKSRQRAALGKLRSLVSPLAQDLEGGAL